MFFRSSFPRARGASRQLVALFLAAAAAASSAELNLTGRIVDENDATVHDAPVSVHALPNAEPHWETLTASNGAFSIALSAPGEFEITVECQGYFPLHRRLQLDSSQDLTLSINTVREVFQSVDVTEKPSPVDIAQAANT